MWFSLQQPTALMMWGFEGEMCLIGLCIRTLDSQLWCCLGVVMELSEGGALLEEVRHWRWALRGSSLCPTSGTHSLLPVCESKCDWPTPIPASMLSLTVAGPFPP